MNDVPTRRHQPTYPLSFADGHSESMKLVCRDTLSWHPPDANPAEVSSDGTINRDLVNLQNVAYSSP